MELKINDRVRFLNDVGGGRITGISGKIATVEDEEGFERPALISELVKIGDGDSPSQFIKPLELGPKHAVSKEVKPEPKPTKEEPTEKAEPVVETPEGDIINLQLVFEPKNIKQLATTDFFPVIVNDSNYYIYFTLLTRGGDDIEWTARHNALLEPNFQLTLDPFGHSELNSMEHIAVQYVAFKQGKSFKLKTPALVTKKLDLTKFFKLHCFRPNEYFDTAVLAIDITRNDRPVKAIELNAKELENALRGSGKVGKPSDSKRSKPNQDHRHDIIIQDLHISELLDDIRGLSNSDILNYQLETFRHVMRENQKNSGQKIVFIHGKGEGVLRRALLDELKKNWPACAAQDASFQEYGFGATQITIHRSKD